MQRSGSAVTKTQETSPAKQVLELQVANLDSELEACRSSALSGGTGRDFPQSESQG